MKKPKTRTLYAIRLNGYRGTQTTPPVFLTEKDKVVGIDVYEGQEGHEIFKKTIIVKEDL